MARKYSSRATKTAWNISVCRWKGLLVKCWCFHKRGSRVTYHAGKGWVICKLESC